MLAARLGAMLRAGDVICLDGPVGAGKTHFARSLIQSLQTDPEDVPSPTYTLVQVYDTPGAQIWHADLYRLGSPDEVEELGLTEAFDTAICLIEWPDRLADLSPKTALTMTLTPDPTDETRRDLRLEGAAPHWQDRIDRLDRAALADAFLARTDWRDIPRGPLAGDASNRRYDRLRDPETGQTAVLMDAPPAKGEDIRPFVTMARYLSQAGFSAPRILAEDAEHGFLLLEDLGDDLYARVLTCGGDETALYTAATDLLAALHRHPNPDLAPYDSDVMGDMAALAYSKYRTPILGADPARETAFRSAFDGILRRHVTGPGVVILRDYHAENLLWLPERDGTARVGLLDFQDAMIGHAAYDLVSLLQDARRDVPRAIETAMLGHYIHVTGSNPDAFGAAYAVLGVQRNLRILGVFGRLCTDYGRPSYVDLIPRVWGHLMRSLDHPALAPVADQLRADLPEPTPVTLARLKALCPTP